MGMIASALQIVGLAALVIAAFLVWLPLGCAAVGIACLAVGLSLER